LRSRGERFAQGAVYIADTMGELHLLYAAAPVSFVGGSLLAGVVLSKSGHFPLGLICYPSGF
jgi:3-deoxy-D-manno-octulosonic-acid transferase